MSECERSEARGAKGYTATSVGSVLGAVQIVLNNHLHGERPEGEAWACNLYLLFSLIIIIDFSLLYTFSMQIDPCIKYG